MPAQLSQETAAQMIWRESGDVPLDLAVNHFGIDDLVDGLRRGAADFKAMPSHMIFLSLIYPIIGLLLGRMAFGYDVLPLLFPIMAVWGLIIAAGMVIGSLPFFIGLAIVMPIFGHASWHLYRKVIAH